MKPIKCHRKYPITTNFLDTMLEHYVDIQEGESKLDAYRRGLKELDQIAAELRKEANQHLYQEKDTGLSAKSFAGMQVPHPSTIPIISKDWDKVEIAIDNAETVDELKDVKTVYPLMPAKLIDYYNKRMEELIIDAPKNFTDGLS